jgi:hypothetical protein
MRTSSSKMEVVQAGGPTRRGQLSRVLFCARRRTFTLGLLPTLAAGALARERVERHEKVRWHRGGYRRLSGMCAAVRDPRTESLEARASIAFGTRHRQATGRHAHDARQTPCTICAVPRVAWSPTCDAQVPKRSASADRGSRRRVRDSAERPTGPSRARVDPAARRCPAAGTGSVTRFRRSIALIHNRDRFNKIIDLPGTTVTVASRSTVRRE